MVEITSYSVGRRFGDSCFSCCVGRSHRGCCTTPPLGVPNLPPRIRTPPLLREPSVPELPIQRPQYPTCDILPKRTFPRSNPLSRIATTAISSAAPGAHGLPQRGLTAAGQLARHEMGRSDALADLALSRNHVRREKLYGSVDLSDLGAMLTDLSVKARDAAGYFPALRKQSGNGFCFVNLYSILYFAVDTYGFPFAFAP